MNTKFACLLAAAAIALGPSAQAQVPSYVPSGGLLGWWPLDGNPNDVSTNGNHFTNNGATNATDRFGAGNAAYQFNGSNSHLINTAFSHTFSDTGSFSVSFWMKKASTAYGVAVMSGSNTAGNFVWMLQCGGAMTFSTNEQQQSWVGASSPYPVNTWTHFVGTYNASAMKLYKDGVLVGTASFPYTGTLQANLPLYVGRAIGGSYFNGSLDDIGIWDRALSAAEIGALYTGGCGALVATQPIDLQVNLGDNAQFSVTPGGSPATYQWQTDQGLGFQNVTNGGQYYGATTANLTIANTTLANDAQPFRCRVSVGICTDTSDVAVLTVNNNIGTAEHLHKAGISTYPNPVTDEMTIKTEAGLIGSSYVLADPQGRVVRTGRITAEFTRLDLGELPRGAFVLSVGGPDALRLRVVKQ